MDQSQTPQPAPVNENGQLSKKQRRRLEKMRAKQERAAAVTTKRAGSRIVFWLIILAVIAFFVYAVGKLATSGPDTDGTQTDMAITASDHTLGTPGSSVELIEYADFQCPGCAAFAPIVKQVVDEYKDKIAYAYRHFPLPQHAHAVAMGRAAEAAALQGKFWQMHDLIYENQRAWTSLPSVTKTINDYAAQLKLDLAQFESDFKSDATEELVEADYESGQGYGVNSTPSFFINGKAIALPNSVEAFKAAIEAALAAANATSTADEQTN